MTNTFRANAEPKSASAPDWAGGVEIDLQTALALARASTQALLHLSPLAHREMVEALAHEIGLLERRDRQMVAAAANAVRSFLPQAA